MDARATTSSRRASSRRCRRTPPSSTSTTRSSSRRARSIAARRRVATDVLSRPTCRNKKPTRVAPRGLMWTVDLAVALALALGLDRDGLAGARDVDRLHALVVLLDLELDDVPGRERPEAVHLDGGVVDEDVLRHALLLDESVPLLVVE